MSTFTSTRLADANPRGYTLQQTMLRIKDPKKSVDFYTQHFGFQKIHQYDFPEWNFSLYFLAILPDTLKCPTPGTKESEEFLWDLPIGVSTLELTHNYGSETDDTFSVNNGNVEPYRGFGHIAVMCPDVYSASTELENNGINIIIIHCIFISNHYHYYQE
jgi:lactoylglutathione lyase